MKVKFDGKDLEIESFSLFDLAQLEDKGVSVQRISESKKPTAKDLVAIIGYAVRRADSTYKTDEEVAKKIGMDNEMMTKIVKAVLPGGKSQIPFTSK